MKKKTAITLGALALLAGGITFGGFKIKEKKEKDKIEKELKEILIPNAEQELEELMSKDKALADSIHFYNMQMDQNDNDSLISKSDYDTIYKLLDDIHKDLSQEWANWAQKYDKYYVGEGFYSDNMPEAGKKQFEYLSQGIVYKILTNKDLIIPGYTMEHTVHTSYYNNTVNVRYEKTPLLMPEPYPPFNMSVRNRPTYGLIYDLQRSLDCTRPEFVISDSTIRNDKGWLLTGSDQEELIITLKYFVDNIDNSKGVIKQETLENLTIVVNSLVVKSQTKNISGKRKKNENNRDKFWVAQSKLSRKISTKQDTLKQYKSPDIVKKMYRDQRKK